MKEGETNKQKDKLESKQKINDQSSLNVKLETSSNIQNQLLKQDNINGFIKQYIQNQLQLEQQKNEQLKQQIAMLEKEKQMIQQISDIKQRNNSNNIVLNYSGLLSANRYSSFNQQNHPDRGVLVQSSHSLNTCLYDDEDEKRRKSVLFTNELGLTAFLNDDNFNDYGGDNERLKEYFLGNVIFDKQSNLQHYKNYQNYPQVIQKYNELYFQKNIKTYRKNVSKKYTHKKSAVASINKQQAKWSTASKSERSNSKSPTSDKQKKSSVFKQRNNSKYTGTNAPQQRSSFAMVEDRSSLTSQMQNQQQQMIFEFSSVKLENKNIESFQQYLKDQTISEEYEKFDSVDQSSSAVAKQNIYNNNNNNRLSNLSSNGPSPKNRKLNKSHVSFDQ